MRFAHPSEEAFAYVLDHFDIPYEYEKYTFIIERGDDGQIRKAFTPDFYIPNERIFVELTSMETGRANRKRRKIEAVKEMYDIDVILMCANDLSRFTEDFAWILSMKR